MSRDVIDKLLLFWNNPNERTRELNRNLFFSIVLKGLSIIISFLIVPITIDYVNPVQYGIWLTISSLIAWFFFFDIGLSNGFRNRFAEAKANNDLALSKILVSTTFALLMIVSLIMLTIVVPIVLSVNWSSILKVSEDYSKELKTVFLIMTIFMGMNLVSQVVSSLVTANQKPAVASLIQVVGQFISLAVIFLLTKIFNHGDLIQLAFVFSGIPVIILILAGVLLFNTTYRKYKPSIRDIQFSYVKSIFGIGVKFFIITVSMLVIFQLMNLIISRELGPDKVTEYNIAFKYFNVLYMVGILVINPFWSAFTDAYSRKDFAWMKNQMRKLEKLGLLALLAMLIMWLIADRFYHIWVGEMVTVSETVNIAVAVYVLFLFWSNIYMYMINGIGTVNIQLMIYLIFALFSYPVMSFMCKKFGIPGLLVIPTLVYLLQCILGKIQLNKILNERAAGIWKK